MKKSNFLRAFKNIVNKDNKHLIKDVIYRSYELKSLKPKQIEKIKEHNVKYIFDLRTDDESKERPDVYPEGVNYIHLPVLTNEQNPSVNKDTRIDVLRKINSQKGKGKGHLCHSYELLITSPQAIENYRKFFDYLLANENRDPFVYHCTQGKDRTGVATFFLLFALGFDEKTIYKDYMSYNRMYRIKNFFIFIILWVRFMSFSMTNSLHASLTAQKAYFETAINEMKKMSGSVDNYVRDVLLLDDAKIAKLKDLYLEK